jgi:hypothetical protein
MERIDGATEGMAPRHAEVVRLWPIRVLVVSPDRYFRAAAAMLIGRRGCTVITCDGELEVGELAARERIDVLLLERPEGESRRSSEAPVRSLASAIDLAMARQGIRCAPIGVVVVSEFAAADRTATPHALELDKWGPFEELFRAIVRADKHRRLPREQRFLPWPAAARHSSAD